MPEGALFSGDGSTDDSYWDLGEKSGDAGGLELEGIKAHQMP